MFGALQLGLGLTRHQGSGLPWHPHRLFQSGDILLWYDPSDLTTMFKNTSGTQPVTADGDSVALMLDKGQWGGKTLEQVLAAQPELEVGFGPIALSGLDTTSVHSGAVVGKKYYWDIEITDYVSGTFFFNYGDVSNAGLTPVEGNPTFASNGRRTFMLTAPANTVSFRVRSSGGPAATVTIHAIREIPGYHRTQATGTSMPKYKTGPNPAAAEASPELVLNGTFDTDSDWTKGTGWSISAGMATKASGTASGLDQAGTFGAAKAYRVTYTISGRTAGGLYPAFTGGTSVFGVTTSANGTFTQVLVSTGNNNARFFADASFDGSIDDISVKEIPASAPYIHWLLYDGTDDGHATGTITWGTDEVAVCAGVTKSSDAAAGVIVELSATSASNNGTFALLAPSSAAANYFWRTKGTAASDQTRTTYAAPTTDVLTGMGKIATDSNRFRIDSDEATAATDQGTGNFGSYPLYFGRRAGTSFPFSGREYQTVIRSRLLSEAELSSLETFVAAKTGVIL